MKEYEISNDLKVLGNVKIYNNVDSSIKKTFINTLKDYKYEIINNKNLQLYIIKIKVNELDELYDKVSIYINDDIFDEIERIKKYNKIKNIKKDTILDIIIPSNYLEQFKIDIKDINLHSLLESKVFFIKKTLENDNNLNIKSNLEDLVKRYNDYKTSKEYEFLSDEEKEKNIEKYINESNNLINIIEKNTNYKYGENFIQPIKINNNI